MGKDKPLSGLVALSLVFIFPRPKSWPKSRKQLYHRSRPDVDNLQKFILDAGNNILWNDDCQIVNITASKLYGPEPKTIMIITEVEE